MSSTDYNEDVSVFPEEVFDAVVIVKDNKACAMDKISADHLKFASRKLCPLLAICFTGLMVLPASIFCAVSVHIIKGKAGKINNNQNYRPITLASILSKILERTLLGRFVGAILYLFILFIFLVSLQVKSLRS